MFMKLFFLTALLLGIIGAMVFGVFLMIHPDGFNNHSECPVALVDRRTCDSGIGALEYIRIHASALSGFVAPLPAIVSLLIFALGIFIAAFFRLGKSVIFAPDIFVFRFARVSRTTGASEKLRAWFAMHEKRDPSPFLRP